MRSKAVAISAYGNPKASRSTNTARSSGESDSRTTSTASETESASTARSAVSGRAGPKSVTTGSGSQDPGYDSRRDCRCRSRSMASRVVIRTRKARGSRMSSRAAADHLSHASWTTSSASAMRPSMR